MAAPKRQSQINDRYVRAQSAIKLKCANSISGFLHNLHIGLDIDDRVQRNTREGMIFDEQNAYHDWS
jgi:hypothetical protein